LGVPASGEGGNPLTDSGAVVSLLAVLHLADHPGDRILRYHVARTPFGEVLGFTDPADGPGARRLAHRLRRRLMQEGYGRTVAALARQVEGFCDARELRRLAQLGEMAFRYDEAATLRPGDFVRLVEAERVEDPTEAQVRVMTVHKSKGLEFDIVVLPELDAPLIKGRTKALAYRPAPTEPITRVFPYISPQIRALFPDVPELEAAAAQARGAEVRDALSGLYVGMTRARHALHLLIKPDGPKGPGKASTSARIVRNALDALGPAADGDLLFAAGDPRWFDALPPRRKAAETPSGTTDAVLGDTVTTASGGEVRLRPVSRRARALPRVVPSQMAGGARVEPRTLLRLESGAAERGTLIHAWAEQIGWIEDGLPSDEEMLALARRKAPALPEKQVRGLIGLFRGWVQTPEIWRVLSRAAYPAGAELEREAPFVYRQDDLLVEGVVDRLVLLREEERVVGARILDFKSDASNAPGLSAVGSLVAHYQPQMAAYRQAIAQGWRLAPESVTGSFVFLAAGVVAEAGG
nr:PD-(D/E)XK nuclease family protein [Gemmatimonadota bacterium]